MNRILILIAGISLLLGMASFSDELNFDFDKAWKEVEELQKKRLPKSALEKVEIIYKHAVKERNEVHQIKALNYKAALTIELEEKGYKQALLMLQSHLTSSKEPVRQVLHSIIADLYATYFSQQRYRIGQRTPVSDNRPEDFEMWTVSDFLDVISYHYLKSTENIPALLVPVDKYKPLLNKYNEAGKSFRPTLFEVLSDKALNYLKGAQSHLTQPVYAFSVDQDIYYEDAQTFVKAEIETKDTTSTKWKTLKLFQEVLSTQLEYKNREALVDFDFNRLQFVHNHSVLEDKNEQYQKALERMMSAYEDVEQYTSIVHLYAQLLMSKNENPNRFVEVRGLCSSAINKYPNSKGALNLQNLINSIERKELNLALENVYLPDVENLFQMTYKNIDQAFLKVIRLDEKEINKINRNRTLTPEIIEGAEKVMELTLRLPHQNLHHLHSVEQILPSLDFGTYAVVASTNSRFKGQNNEAFCYALFRVSNLSYAVLSQDNGLIVVTNRKTGKPLANINIEIGQQSYDRKSRTYVSKLIRRVKTDKDGMVKVGKGLTNNIFIVLINGNDRLDLRHFFSIYTPGKERSYSREHIFTDRSIYRPGQTIYFKALLVHYDQMRLPEIRKNEKVQVVLRDVNNQEVATLGLTSNEFGSVSGSFTLPDVKLTGRYSINVGNSNHGVQVEEYKRPRFEVTMDTIASAFKLDDEVVVSGSALNLSGNPVDEGLVKYVVTRKVRFAPWRYRYFPGFDDGGTQISSGTISTDDKGHFEFPVTLVPDKTHKRGSGAIFHFEIVVDVTDVTGETRSSTTFIKAGYSSFELTSKAASEYAKRSLTPIVIEAVNHSGQTVEKNLSVTVHSLNSPSNLLVNKYWSNLDTSVIDESDYLKKFPHYSQKGLDKISDWDIMDEVLNLEVESGQELDLSGLDAGDYRIIATAEDEEGNEVRYQHDFSLNDFSKGAFSKSGWLQKNDNGNTFEPGETVNWDLGTAHDALYVLLEINRPNEPVQRRWVHINQSASISETVRESDRGGMSISLTYFYENRAISQAFPISIPWSNKELKIEYVTMRDNLLPGSKEEWIIRIKGAKGEKVSAELLASMYDASLDQLAAHNWNQIFFPKYYNNKIWRLVGFHGVNGQHLNYRWNQRTIDLKPTKIVKPGFTSLFYNLYDNLYAKRRGAPMAEAMMDNVEVTAAGIEFDQESPGGEKEESLNGVSESKVEEVKAAPLQVRKNLEETVFFFPQVGTDNEGNFILKFQMKEALTRWKFQTFAHTPEMEYVFDTKEVVTQKDLMVFPNAPRFVRQGDRLTFSGKVVNMTSDSISGQAELMLFDALTMQPIGSELGLSNATVAFNIEEGRSAPVSWNLEIPTDYLGAITYRMVAKSGSHTDGEESTIPVVSNRMLVTETLPMHIRGGETKQFSFKAMEKQSSTLVHHKYALEITSNPVWYAIQALPYLMEYPHECTEQIVNRLYSNSLATTIANSHPKINRVFEEWKGRNAEALLSNLSKNQKLKSALLEETPWVLQAESESAQKRNIALLFDLNKMANEKADAISKLVQRQSSNGGFSWMPGGRDNEYITQYVLEDLGHLIYLGVLSPDESGIQKMIRIGLDYCDKRLRDRYNKLVEVVQRNKGKMDDDHLSNLDIHYLYMRSFYDQDIEASSRKAVAYYQGQAEKHWTNKSTYLQGMLGLVALRNQNEHANDIAASLEERAVSNEELGVYWKDVRGYRWFELPIERQALMIELFTELGSHQDMVESMKIWLLKNKQTTNWKTTKATAAAIYALLLNDKEGGMSTWILEDDLPVIKLGDVPFKIDKSSVEAGTGYFKKTYAGSEVSSDMTQIEVTNPNEVVAWGAAYWQYFEDMDKVETFEDTPLTLSKKLYLQKQTDSGIALREIKENTILNPGDKITVRIELRCDRDMEFLHLKDMRASGLEPINVLSRYRYQDGLGYYESTKDLATHFFISYLPKGEFVFEYPVVVVQSGSFSGGIASIQCMYAPEFSSHSEGLRVDVGN